MSVCIGWSGHGEPQNERGGIGNCKKGGVVREDGKWWHCLFRGLTLFYSKTNYTVTKTSLPQGTRLLTPGDRLHKHRQAFLSLVSCNRIAFSKS